MNFRPPEPGSFFAVRGRSDELIVLQLIASFSDEEKGDAHYLVEARAGSRWILVENEQADDPRWVGRPVPADTNGL